MCVKFGLQMYANWDYWSITQEHGSPQKWYLLKNQVINDDKMKIRPWMEIDYFLQFNINPFV